MKRAALGFAALLAGCMESPEAPISPGSSGGGLFDARGNLVGITTPSFVGEKHLHQSLNFAIAAEMFWSP